MPNINMDEFSNARRNFCSATSAKDRYQKALGVPSHDRLDPGRAATSNFKR